MNIIIVTEGKTYNRRVKQLQDPNVSIAGLVSLPIKKGRIVVENHFLVRSSDK